MTDLVWVIPIEGQGEERRAAAEARSQLIAPGYREFRAQCAEAPAAGRGAHLYDRANRTQPATAQLAFGAARLRWGYASFRVFAADGSSVLP